MSKGNDVAQLNEIDQMDKVGAETLLALLSTKTNTEAAERLGIERSTLWYRIQKYKLDEMIEKVPKEALMRLQLSSTRAAEKLIEKLDDRKDGLQAATEILDRVGLVGNKGSGVNIQGEKVIAILGGLSVSNNDGNKEDIIVE